MPCSRAFLKFLKFCVDLNDEPLIKLRLLLLSIIFLGLFNVWLDFVQSVISFLVFGNGRIPIQVILFFGQWILHFYKPSSISSGNKRSSKWRIIFTTLNVPEIIKIQSVKISEITQTQPI